MYFEIDQLRIYLESDDPQIDAHVALFLEGWPVKREHPHGAVEVELCLRLKLAEGALPAPPGEPVFTDMLHHWPGEIGRFSLYQEENSWLLSFQDCGLARIRLTAAGEPEPMVDVQITPYAWQYGRLPDVIFSSLAPLLRRQGYYFMHAFVASYRDQALVLTGSTGSGKTTSGLHLIAKGWEYPANDVALLHERAGGIYALPVPGSMSLRPETLLNFPRLIPYWQPHQALFHSEHKFILPVRDFAAGWAAAKPVGAICFPVVQTRQFNNLEPLNRSMALARLMESSLDVWDQASLPQHSAFLQRLCRQTPAFTLQLGQAMDELPAQLAQLLSPVS